MFLADAPAIDHQERVMSVTTPYHDRRIVERRKMNFAPMLATGDGLRVSWGGIWGGVLAALGLLILLSALGMAVGISAVKPGETDASRSAPARESGRACRSSSPSSSAGW
jgi:hypothetical protein